MPRPWPWPDTREDRIKRIAESYRTALQEHAPEVCRLLDARMIEYGQKWICADTIIEVDKLVTAEEAAEELGINPWNVHDWSRRSPEVVPKRGRRDGKTLFRLGDILARQAAP